MLITYFKYSSRQARSPELVARTIIIETSLKHLRMEFGINLFNELLFGYCLSFLSQQLYILFSWAYSVYFHSEFFLLNCDKFVEAVFIIHAHKKTPHTRTISNLSLAYHHLISFSAKFHLRISAVLFEFINVYFILYCAPPYIFYLIVSHRILLVCNKTVLLIFLLFSFHSFIEIKIITISAFVCLVALNSYQRMMFCTMAINRFGR